MKRYFRIVLIFIFFIVFFTIGERELVAKSLPKSIDYTERMSPVTDQGKEGTCLAFATVDGVKEYQEMKERGKFINLSVRYVYQRYEELKVKLINKMISNNKRLKDIQKRGSIPLLFFEKILPLGHLEITMKVLQEYGVCPEEYWPYIPRKPGKSKVTNIDRYAEPHKIKSYTKLSSIKKMKKSLVSNGPFVAEAEVFSNWFRVKKDGIIEMPQKNQKSLDNNHAICIVGYDDENKLFKFKNSWGTKWGKKGYGYLSYQYVKRYLYQAYSATDIIDSEPH